MKRLLPLFLLSCSSPAIPVEEIDEAQMKSPCRALEGGWNAERVEILCGRPARKAYSTENPDVVAWVYCRGECAQRYLVVFWGGSTIAWGDAYEVIQ